MKSLNLKKWMVIVVLLVIAIGAAIGMSRGGIGFQVKQSQLVEAQKLTDSGNYEEARAIYDQMIADKHDLAAALEGRGNLNSLTRNFTEAIQDYTDALVLNKTANLLASRCNANRIWLYLDKALADCQEAVTMDPKNVDAGLALAELYRSTKDTPKAKAEYERLLNVVPKNSKVFFIGSQLAIDEGDLVQAEQLLTSSIELDPTNPNYYWERGFLYISLAKVDQAKKDMHSILKYANPIADGELIYQASNALGMMGDTP